jgi:hypothetical protein
VSLQRTLAIVLGVQLLLVAVFWWPRDPAAGSRPVFDVGRADIERIEIETRPAAGAEPSPLVLVRDDDRWKLASAADYPADPEKVEQLIDSLVALRAGSAIATRAASHSALNVANDNYGRRILVAAGGCRRVVLPGRRPQLLRPDLHRRGCRDLRRRGRPQRAR